MGNGRIIAPVRRLDHMGHRIHAESGETEGEPKIDDPLDLFMYFGMSHVQIRLEVIELMVIILSGDVIVGPEARLFAGKDIMFSGSAGGGASLTDVVSAIARAAVTPSCFF